MGELDSNFDTFVGRLKDFDVSLGSVGGCVEEEGDEQATASHQRTGGKHEEVGKCH